MNGANGASALTRVVDIADGDERCPSGGQIIQVGADLNGNSVLDDDEVQSEAPVCLSSATVAEDSSCSVGRLGRKQSPLGYAAGLALLVGAALRRRERRRG
jgi:hypothetical protein